MDETVIVKILANGKFARFWVFWRLWLFYCKPLNSCPSKWLGKEFLSICLENWLCAIFRNGETVNTTTNQIRANCKRDSTRKREPYLLTHSAIPLFEIETRLRMTFFRNIQPRENGKTNTLEIRLGIRYSLERQGKVQLGWLRVPDEIAAFFMKSEDIFGLDPRNCAMEPPETKNVI